MKYLHGISDMCSKLLFGCKSGTHILNMRNWVDIVLETVVKLVFFFCECECESV